PVCDAFIHSCFGVSLTLNWYWIASGLQPAIACTERSCTYLRGKSVFQARLFASVYHRFIAVREAVLTGPAAESASAGLENSPEPRCHAGEPVCPICASDSMRSLRQKADHNLVICPCCRHVTWREMPTGDDLRHYYSNSYTEKHGQEQVQARNVDYYTHHAR